MSTLTRWDGVSSPPPARRALRDLVVRSILPAAGLFALMCALGLLLVDVLGDPEPEDDLVWWLQEQRTPTGEAVTHLFSSLGNTPVVIGIAALGTGVVMWRTRRWWYAVVPLLAITLQSLVFVSSAAVVGRDRPDVERLDPTPPTASFPSGHVSAATAVWTSFALYATRIENLAARRAVVVLCLIVPPLVAFARVYRGAHHVSDVLAGILNGVVCAFLAWRWLRTEEDDAPSGEAATARSSADEEPDAQSLA